MKGYNMCLDVQLCSTENIKWLSLTPKMKRFRFVPSSPFLFHQFQLSHPPLFCNQLSQLVNLLAKAKYVSHQQSKLFRFLSEVIIISVLWKQASQTHGTLPHPLAFKPNPPQRFQFSLPITNYNSMLCRSLSPRRGPSSDCGWRRRPPDMKDSCKYIEWAVADSRQGLVLQLAC